MTHDAGAVYEGWVRHRRISVRPRAFQHPLALAYLDLDRLDQILDGRLTAARPGIVRFRRRDYLGDPREPLSEEVRRLVEQRTGWRPDGAVRLLTHLRTFGHCFNPVSFYFCFDAQDRLGAVVAEVTNTPWGERHAYVLRSEREGAILSGGFDKRLHVSPFMGMDQHYLWRATTPGATISLQIENHERDRRVFAATLSLRRLELTQKQLRRLIWRYPLGTVRVLALIYGHALVLWLKRVPVYAKPGLAA